MKQCVLEEKYRVAGLPPCFSFVGISCDRSIGGNDCPTLFIRESFKPIDICNICGESIAEVNHLVVWLRQTIQRMSYFRRQIIVTEKSHAAKFCSNSTASLTSSTSTSNHCATSLFDVPALTARKRTSVRT